MFTCVTRFYAFSDLSLNAMSVKLLNHPECNKPTNMLIWGIAPGTYRDEVFPYPQHVRAPHPYLTHCNSHGHRPSCLLVHTGTVAAGFCTRATTITGTQAGRTTAKRKIQSIQPYMAILYEECMELYHKGVRTWDAYKQEFFPLRMLVFDVMCDFPGPLIIKCPPL